uniref:Lipopolysaccharide heptosyltransferase I n=1 Tax=uncultured Alphaproteobacteria bacterium TaxID=91750 RepID=A0A1B0Z1M1_9PROT|nr:lipopolysaccharide heptosyltransferase I [uncultured Alphaproteobacteria bacterium]
MNRALLYNSGGGIGDAIQILPLISTLRNEFKNTKFYYLSAHENHFNSTLKDLNCEIETLDLGIKYFGFRWWHSLVVNKKIKKHDIESFDLILDLQSKIRNSLILKLIPHKKFISPSYNFKLSKPSLNIKKEDRIDKMILKAMNTLLEKNYTLSEYDINKIHKKFHFESEKLLPKKDYVGLSITQGNIYRKKEWPLDKVIKISNKLLENNKIPVFFIEKKNIQLKNKINELIPNALFPEHTSEISGPALVACLGKRLDFAISIDNGVMHMLSLSKVPMITLFGPTDPEKFAPQYKDSIVLDSKKIYNTRNVSDITVEDVLKAAKLHLNFSY